MCGTLHTDTGTINIIFQLPASIKSIKVQYNDHTSVQDHLEPMHIIWYAYVYRTVETWLFSDKILIEILLGS